MQLACWLRRRMMGWGVFIAVTRHTTPLHSFRTRQTVSRIYFSTSSVLHDIPQLFHHTTLKEFRDGLTKIPIQQYSPLLAIGIVAHLAHHHRTTRCGFSKTTLQPEIRDALTKCLWRVVREPQLAPSPLEVAADVWEIRKAIKKCEAKQIATSLLAAGTTSPTLPPSHTHSLLHLLSITATRAHASTITGLATERVNPLSPRSLTFAWTALRRCQARAPPQLLSCSLQALSSSFHPVLLKQCLAEIEGRSLPVSPHDRSAIAANLATVVPTLPPAHLLTVIKVLRAIGVPESHPVISRAVRRVHMLLASFSAFRTHELVYALCAIAPQRSLIRALAHRLAHDATPSHVLTHALASLRPYLGDGGSSTWDISRLVSGGMSRAGREGNVGLFLASLAMCVDVGPTQLLPAATKVFTALIPSMQPSEITHALNHWSKTVRAAHTHDPTVIPPALPAIIAGLHTATPHLTPDETSIVVWSLAQLRYSTDPLPFNLSDLCLSILTNARPHFATLGPQAIANYAAAISGLSLSCDEDLLFLAKRLCECASVPVSVQAVVLSALSNLSLPVPTSLQRLVELTLADISQAIPPRDLAAVAIAMGKRFHGTHIREKWSHQNLMQRVEGLQLGPTLTPAELAAIATLAFGMSVLDCTHVKFVERVLCLPWGELVRNGRVDSGFVNQLGIVCVDWLTHPRIQRDPETCGKVEKLLEYTRPASAPLSGFTAWTQHLLESITECLRALGLGYEIRVLSGLGRLVVPLVVEGSVAVMVVWKGECADGGKSVGGECVGGESVSGSTLLRHRIVQRDGLAVVCVRGEEWWAMEQDTRSSWLQAAIHSHNP